MRVRNSPSEYQREQQYSFEIKKEVVQRRLARETRMDLAREFGLSSDQLVKDWSRKWRKGGDDALKPKPKGRPKGSVAPKRLTEEDKLRRQIARLEGPSGATRYSPHRYHFSLMNSQLFVSKWIDTHRQLLQLLLASFGTTDLGLRRNNSRLRYLNHAPALSNLEIPLADAAALTHLTDEEQRAYRPSTPKEGCALSRNGFPYERERNHPRDAR